MDTIKRNTKTAAEQYAKELGKVLRTFDPEKMRKFSEKRNPGLLERYPSLANDRYMRGSMAKMVLIRTDMGYKTKAKAREILDDLGWDYRIH